MGRTRFFPLTLFTYILTNKSFRADKSWWLSLHLSHFRWKIEETKGEKQNKKAVRAKLVDRKERIKEQNAVCTILLSIATVGMQILFPINSTYDALSLL